LEAAAALMLHAPSSHHTSSATANSNEATPSGVNEYTADVSASSHPASSTFVHGRNDWPPSSPLAAAAVPPPPVPVVLLLLVGEGDPDESGSSATHVQVVLSLSPHPPVRSMLVMRLAETEQLAALRQPAPPLRKTPVWFVAP